MTAQIATINRINPPTLAKARRTAVVMIVFAAEDILLSYDYLETE
jgi:hypothetical protein